MGKLIAYLHERIHINDPKNPEAIHTQPVSSLFRLFIVFAKIGSGALQLVKGNVLFTVMVVMKSKDEQVRLPHFSSLFPLSVSLVLLIHHLLPSSHF